MCQDWLTMCEELNRMFLSRRKSLEWPTIKNLQLKYGYMPEGFVCDIIKVNVETFSRGGFLPEESVVFRNLTKKEHLGRLKKWSKLWVS